jgi:hypothetical protein
MSDFSAQFTDICVQTIVWQRKIGKDAFGKVIYEDPPTVFSPFTSPGLGGRRTYKTVRRMSGGGGTPGGAAVDFIQVSYIWILAAPMVGLDDRVYVEGDPEPYPPITGIDRPVDETGEAVYTKVTLGSYT